MRLIRTFFRIYPQQSVTALLALLLAGLAEGFGLSMLLPLLGVTISNLGGTEAQAGKAPSTLEQMLDGFFHFTGITPTPAVFLTFFAVGILVTALLALIANKKVGYTVAQVATDLRLSLIKSLFASRWQYYVNQPVGSLSNAFATEANRAADSYLYAIRTLAQVLRALVFTIVALLMAWKETLSALLAGFVILFILRKLVTRAKRAGQRQTNLLNSLLSLLTDTLQSIKPLKAMAREDMAARVLLRETGGLNQALQKEVFSKEALKALQEPLITAFFAFGIYVAIVWWRIPLATVITMAFMLIKILKSLQNAQKEHQNMVIAESAYWSLTEKIKRTGEEPEDVSGTQGPCFEESIRLDQVSFAYGTHGTHGISGEKQVLRGLSLEFPSGSFSALTGPSGAGKTTVVDLVTRLLAPQKGRVLLDGVDLAEIELRAWRRMIGYVPQETLLLHDTVRFNVTLGDERFSDADVKEALEAAGAGDFVAQLPGGMDAVVGERGSRLSGGQRQRITIARALIHKPKLLILDEATSALDPASEAEICATLKELRGSLTILAISHQNALVEAADHIYRLQDGQALRMPAVSALTLQPG
ncbi:MAG: ABC transporter ATP-binding protein [bacterium]|nr:ABC transporter ATP-binding protein [bacterium]